MIAALAVRSARPVRCHRCWAVIGRWSEHVEIEGLGPTRILCRQCRPIPPPRDRAEAAARERHVVALPPHPSDHEVGRTHPPTEESA